MSEKKTSEKTLQCKAESLKAEEMEQAAGGVSDDLKRNIGAMLGLRDHAFCKSCGQIIDVINGVYRCTNPRCPSIGLPQSDSDVDWRRA